MTQEEKQTKSSDRQAANPLEKVLEEALLTASKQKAKARDLTDEQIETIAAEAKIDPANLAIFMNGYHLYCKRVS